MTEYEGLSKLYQTNVEKLKELRQHKDVMLKNNTILISHGFPISEESMRYFARNHEEEQTVLGLISYADKALLNLRQQQEEIKFKAFLQVQKEVQQNFKEI